MVGEETPRTVQDTLTNLRIKDGVAGPPTGPLTLEDVYKQLRMRLIRLALLLVEADACCSLLCFEIGELLSDGGAGGGDAGRGPGASWRRRG